MLVDEVGDLWITRADAPSVAQIVRKWDARDQARLTRDRVAFAYRTVDEKGHVQPQVIVRRSDGKFDLINPDGVLEIGSDKAYRWDRALWVKRERDEGLIVPTDTGVAITPDASQLWVAQGTSIYASPSDGSGGFQTQLAGGRLTQTSANFTRIVFGTTGSAALAYDDGGLNLVVLK